MSVIDPILYESSERVNLISVFFGCTARGCDDTIRVMGIAERRLRERQQRIKGILDAACRIFRLKGYHNTTMNDIADHSELSRRTLYLYFNSKEQLSLAVTAGTLTELEETFARITASDVSSLKKLQLMLDSYRNLMAQDPGRFQFLVSFHENARAVPKDSEDLTACERSLVCIEKSISSVLSAGRAEGSLSFPEEPHRLASTVLFMVHTAAAASVSYKGSILQDDGTMFAELFENMLAILETHITGKR